MADLKSYIDTKLSQAVPKGLRAIYLGAQGIHEGQGEQHVPNSSAATMIWQDTNYYSKVWYRPIIQNQNGNRNNLTPISPGYIETAMNAITDPQATGNLKAYIDTKLAPNSGLIGIGISATERYLDQHRDNEIVLPAGAIVVSARYERGDQHAIIGYKYLFKILSDGKSTQLSSINENPGQNIQPTPPQTANDLKSYIDAKASQKLPAVVDVALGKSIKIDAPSDGATIKKGYFVTQYHNSGNSVVIRPLMYKLTQDTQWRLVNDTPL